MAIVLESRGKHVAVDGRSDMSVRVQLFHVLNHFLFNTSSVNQNTKVFLDLLSVTSQPSSSRSTSHPNALCPPKKCTEKG